MRQPRNAWDSPLLLIGGGTLIGLLLLGAVLLYVMKRQTGDQALEQAEQDYKAGAFAQSIYKFDQYLEKFPKHGSVSSARASRLGRDVRGERSPGLAQGPGHGQDGPGSNLA